MVPDISASPPDTVGARVLWGMALLVTAYVVGLIVDGDGFSPVVDGWLGVVSVCASAVVCCVAVFRARSRRTEVLLAATAVTSYAAGNTYYYMTVGLQGSISFPNWADAGYLGCYVLMLSALAVSARRHLRGRPAAVWLDGAVGSLGAAAVMAALMGPVMTSVASAPLSLATVVAVAYPAMNIGLVAAVAGIAALLGWGGSQRWSLLLAGLSVHATVNLIYALQLLEEEYVIGTLLDAGWPIGLALMAVWVDNASRTNPSSTHSPEGVRALAVPALATGAGLSVLLLASQAQLSVLAVILAGVTLVVAAGRTQHAFRLLVRLAELRRQATTDDLTGLPNRRAMYTGMTAQLAARADEHQALLLLDLDSFKEVNDSLGHHVGDRLLIKVGARLSAHLRDGDLLSRLGGDEFAVLLGGTDQIQAEAVAVKLRAALAEPLAVDDTAIQTDVSIGIALSPEHGSEVSTLLRRADIAMYKAKTARTGHHVYEFTDDGHGFADREELRAALDSAQLILHYQPKVDLGTGDVHGVEALTRWDHPTRGLIYPDQFLGLIQDAGLMPKMTQLVLEMALDQAATWRGEGQHLSVAVNLSAASLIDPGLPKLISELLESRSVPPSALQVEITEESLLGDRIRVRSVLAQLRATGIRIAVDDFGTGYSSLAYLRDLPLDELKLDRSFITPMADDARAAALVASTIALAHSLGLRMVAEGVEHEVTYTELARNGCDEAQGFYISRAVPAAELDHWLALRRTRAATRLL